MRGYIKERTLELANHILQTGDTVREAAVVFNLSKSTVHNDLSKRLKRLDYAKFEDVQKIFDKHFEEKHLRGGESTRQKYLDSKTKNIEIKNK